MTDTWTQNCNYYTSKKIACANIQQPQYICKKQARISSHLTIVLSQPFLFRHVLLAVTYLQTVTGQQSNKNAENTM